MSEMTREEAIKYLEKRKEKALMLMEKSKADTPINNKVRGTLTRKIEALDMAISALSENKGEWIYDKSIENWRCSKCGQTLPPTGYVGNADFMATHFKFCNYCGADMRGDKAG